MSEQPERPETLGRRQRPRPAADEWIDPVDTAPATPLPPTVSSPAPRKNLASKGRGRVATAQLGTRIEVGIANDLTDQAAEEGVSQRLILERSLQFYIAHSQVALLLLSEAENRNVDPTALLEEALRSYLRSA